MKIEGWKQVTQEEATAQLVNFAIATTFNVSTGETQTYIFIEEDHMNDG